jgi:DNA-binding IclR family transcriptional regulator
MGQRELLKFLQQEASLGNEEYLSMNEIRKMMGVEGKSLSSYKSNLYLQLKQLHKYGYIEMDDEADRWRVKYRAITKKTKKSRKGIPP